MKLDVKFAANDKVIKSNFGEIYEVSDGGYDRGYDDGYKVGEKDGFGNGYDVGKEEGYEAGYNKAESVNPLYYMKVKDFQWQSAEFPEGFDFVLKLKYVPTSLNAMLSSAKGVKTVTLICDAEGTVSFAQIIKETTVETLNLTNFKPIPNNFSYFAHNARKLIKIEGALDLSECTNVTNAFLATTSLEEIEFEPLTIPISISFSTCTKLTHQSLMSIINGLAVVEATQTLTLGTTNLAKLTDEEKAIATEKGWSLA